MSSAKQYRATTTAWADSMAHSEGMSEWPAANLNNVTFVQPGTMTGELATQGSFYEPVQPSSESGHPRLQPPFGLLRPAAAVDSFNEIHKGSRLGDSNIKTARASLADATASYNATWAVDDCEDLAEPRWQKSAIPCGGGGSASGLVTSSCYGRSELSQNNHLRHMCDVQAEAASKQGAVALLRQVVASMGMMDGTAMEAQDFNILLQQVLNARGGVKSGRVSNRSSSQAMATGGDDAMRYAKSSLYKTELCRSWEERGSCRYGAKCQFAHGLHELRPVQRHPKYKTQLCRTFASTGTCPYGKRCRFIHPSPGTTPNQHASVADSPPAPPLQGGSPAALALAAHASVPPLLELQQQQQLAPHVDALALPADPHGSSRQGDAAAGLKRLPVFQQLEISSYADDGSAAQRGSIGSSSGARSSSPSLLLCSSSSSSSSSRQWDGAQGARDGVGAEATNMAASDSLHRSGSSEHSARFGAAPGVAIDSSPDGSSESCSSFFSHAPAVPAPGLHHLLPHLAFSAEQGQQPAQLRSLWDIPGRSTATTWAFSAAAGFAPKAAEPTAAPQLSAVAHPPLPRAAASSEWLASPELLATCSGLAAAPQGRAITMDVDKP